MQFGICFSICIMRKCAARKEQCLECLFKLTSADNVARINAVCAEWNIPECIICIKIGKWAQYFWTWRQSVVPNDAPRDFGPEVAFGDKFPIPVARQGGREMSAPRPYVTDPFHPLSSINT